ncbi:unnamed protein product, partial [Sphacelaria rigidula]
GVHTPEQQTHRVGASLAQAVASRHAWDQVPTLALIRILRSPTGHVSRHLQQHTERSDCFGAVLLRIMLSVQLSLNPPVCHDPPFPFPSVCDAKYSSTTPH